MIHESYIIYVALLFGFYAAWNIGANDVANAMGTSVGSRALTLKQAVILASIFEFLGAVLFGSNVSKTLETGILQPSAFADQPMVLVHGMLAALLGTGLWLQFASYCGLPVSTTHSIVGAIVGFGAVVAGVGAVQWDSVISIACSWVVSPILGAVISSLLFLFLRQKVFYQPHPLEATKKLLPYMAAAVVIVLSLGMMHRLIHKEAHVLIKFAIAIGPAIIVAFIVHHIAKKIKMPKTQTTKDEEYDPHLAIEVDKAKKNLLKIQNALHGEMSFQLSDIVQSIDNFSETLKKKNALTVTDKQSEFTLMEKIFGYLQISSACLMAFAHGSNDVSNAIGPMTAIVTTLQQHNVVTHPGFPTWALIMGGAGIVIGLATWGWRVIETIGRRITELTPSRGFSAEFGAALTILFASRLGLPISTTHTIVGSVFGIGLAGGISALNLNTLKSIILSWLITIPAGAILSIICYYILSAVL
jgi:inorganic phosphate transporter, PiT family